MYSFSVKKKKPKSINNFFFHFYYIYIIYGEKKLITTKQLLVNLERLYHHFYPLAVGCSILEGVPREGRKRANKANEQLREDILIAGWF